VRVLAVAAAALVFGVPAALACNPHPTLGGLEGRLMCPTCKEPLDQSTSPEANRIRLFVTQRIRAGDNDCQIIDKLVGQFGPAILSSPPTKGFGLLAWLLPAIGLIGGAAVIGALAWRWSRARDPVSGSGRQNGRGPLDPELERRLDEELRGFDY
jgi:cytochrome c-type biogenesis protein CcmH/NrfF